MCVVCVCVCALLLTLVRAHVHARVWNPAARRKSQSQEGVTFLLQFFSALLLHLALTLRKQKAVGNRRKPSLRSYLSGGSSSEGVNDNKDRTVVVCV